MNIFEGVLERDVIMKQGGDDKEQPKQNTGEPTDENEQKPKQYPNDQKDNEASGSKGKEKVMFNKEEEEEFSECEKLVRRKRYKELDDILKLRKEVDSQLNFPITPRDFLFRCFENIEKAPL
ncbi:unnamed protein product [Lactuca saligna]|uniref:Uncharacterized protein n=1 Tax=Lactuca saligna TaxID=75948 RepID=A0AA35ZUC6_LACSI|nr:unnamed protein product [Lactuca saligna]